MARGSKCCRQMIEQAEPRYLCRHATFSTDARATVRVYPCPPDDFRSAFQRDYTRIIHSRAFRRLRHKTQVFISPQNDHLCTRLEHSLHVASVANTIARALRLNTDLVEAIAAGHDLGHAPFGHRGERCLDRIAEKVNKKSKRKRVRRFSHELQSLRVVDRLDSPYPDHDGLNLTFAVRDGIACHNGERFEQELAPDRNKKPDDLAGMARGKVRPATLEGCVVRWADKVAYIGRDLEDAYAVGLFGGTDPEIGREVIPRATQDALGYRNGAIIGNLIRDIVQHSEGEDHIAVSSEVHRALNELYDFSMKHIYQSKVVVKYFEQVDRAMDFMFREIERRIAKAQKQGDIAPPQGKTNPRCTEVLAEFLMRDVRTWKEEDSAQLAVDFISGMTDTFFISSFAELFLPVGTV